MFMMSRKKKHSSGLLLMKENIWSRNDSIIILASHYIGLSFSIVEFFFKNIFYKHFLLTVINRG
jgi:hypothetical protein